MCCVRCEVQPVRRLAENWEWNLELSRKRSQWPSLSPATTGLQTDTQIITMSLIFSIASNTRSLSLLSRNFITRQPPAGMKRGIWSWSSCWVRRDPRLSVGCGIASCRQSVLCRKVKSKLGNKESHQTSPGHKLELHCHNCKYFYGWHWHCTDCGCYITTIYCYELSSLQIETDSLPNLYTSFRFPFNSSQSVNSVTTTPPGPSQIKTHSSC